ncbi:hypothetical protein CALVIDRAFT_133986 [Calocera viscosa TUFC12733]|uniref:Uncharacterized protein n=1 Tax=Calocera viscosa (strain TUFC12733) TaxID=1330018 RepID=A0A167LWD0_CALVF|nr:hypothetical protein CALVIDRAFT_133986 [Calocera viscosa TUFC12733]
MYGRLHRSSGSICTFACSLILRHCRPPPSIVPRTLDRSRIRNNKRAFQDGDSYMDAFPVCYAFPAISGHQYLGMHCELAAVKGALRHESPLFGITALPT